MSAQITADVTLRLESESHSVSELLLFAGPDLAASPERGGFFATQSNPEDINIYAVDPATNGKYASYGNGTLVNIPVEIITSKEAAAKQNYTIKFEVYEDAEVLKLKDLVTGEEKDIVNGGSYNFTVTEENAPSYQEGTYSVISNRFVINYDNTVFVTDVTTNEDGWASFAYTEDVRLASPMGLRIYKGSLDNSNPDAPVINLTQVTAIPAGAGVFVKGEPLTTYHFSATTAGALSNNDIVGCTADTDPAGISDAIYTLRNVGGVTALYHYEGTAAIPAGKAYLPIPVGSNPAPQRVRMVINETQGVENVVVEDVKAEKFVENGQIFIKRGEAVYNMQGQIVK